MPLLEITKLPLGGRPGQEEPPFHNFAGIELVYAAAVEQGDGSRRDSRPHGGADPLDFLQRNDAYHFFAAVGGLIKTGPTHTNVCDVRVAITGT